MLDAVRDEFRGEQLSGLQARGVDVARDHGERLASGSRRLLVRRKSLLQHRAFPSESGHRLTFSLQTLEDKAQLARLLGGEVSGGNAVCHERAALLEEISL